MDFFSVTAPDSGLMPKLDKARYSWFYFAIAGTVSLAVFGWWGYKRHAIHSRSVRPDMEDHGNEDADETGMPNVSERIRCREHAPKILDKANSELEELFGKQPSREEDEEEDDDAKATLIERTFQLMEVTICASQAIETGEDVDKLIAKRGIAFIRGIDYLNEDNESGNEVGVSC